MEALNWPRHPGAEPDFETTMDGQKIVLKEQFQLYAQNTHLQMPLVSGALAASLGGKKARQQLVPVTRTCGPFFAQTATRVALQLSFCEVDILTRYHIGLCPLQVIVGGAEILRDEQIYLAHKAADPERYAPCPEVLAGNGDSMEDVTKYPPTDVQLLVFDDCPHAAPTLGHTRGAKHQYRSIAQFAAWALARAQKADIEIEDDASIYSCTTSQEKSGVGFIIVER
jgi:hypothetical protein